MIENFGKYKLNLPQRGITIPDPADIEVITDDFVKLSNALEADEKNLEGHRAAEILDHPSSSVTTEKIRNSAVTAGKIANAAVVEDKLAASAVTTGKLKDDAVTDEKIGDRTIGKFAGKLQALFTKIGDVIKGIKGTTEWNDTPPATLAETRTHIDNIGNPHGVTKAQVGLGNTDNTSDANKPVSTAQAAAIKVVQDDVVSHKADAVKHITAAERTAWNGKENAFTKNTAFNKNFGSAAGTVTEGNDARLSNARPASDVSAWAKATTKPAYTAAEVGLGNVTNDAQVKRTEVVQTTGTSTTNVMSQNAVTQAITAGGNGDMEKRIYDTNGNGIVDNAEKVNGLTVQTAVPSGAKFTDTTYGTGTASAPGLAKLYTGTGSAVDGAMTQSAATTALNGKAATSHTHTSAQISDATNANAANTIVKRNAAGDITVTTVNGYLNGTAAYATVANTANSIAWGSVSGKPSSFTPSSHDHSYLNRSTGAVGTSAAGTEFRSYASGGGTIVDNFCSLGSGSGRWTRVFATNATISTSDARRKTDITSIDHAKELILNLKPIQYKMKESSSGRIHYGFTAQQVKEAMTASGIDDFAGYVRAPLDDNTIVNPLKLEDADELSKEKLDVELDRRHNISNAVQREYGEDEVIYGLVYEELIAPIIAVVQDQQKQIDELTAKLADCAVSP